MKTKQSNANRLAGAGIFTAIVASLCCITPVLALITGTSGIASSFSALEPFRIYLAGITLSVLGLAWYLKLRPHKPEAIQCACEDEKNPSFLQSKMFLGLVTVLAVMMLSFPYYSDIFYPEAKKEVYIVKQDAIQTLELDVRGMTCSSCNRHVEHTALNVHGVLKANASYETGIAVITYDKSKTPEEKIIQSINATGHEVTGSNPVQ